MQLACPCPSSLDARRPVPSPAAAQSTADGRWPARSTGSPTTRSRPPPLPRSGRALSPPRGARCGATAARLRLTLGCGAIHRPIRRRRRSGAGRLRPASAVARHPGCGPGSRDARIAARPVPSGASGVRRGDRRGRRLIRRRRRLRPDAVPGGDTRRAISMPAGAGHRPHRAVWRRRSRRQARRQSGERGRRRPSRRSLPGPRPPRVAGASPSRRVRDAGARGIRPVAASRRHCAVAGAGAVGRDPTLRSQPRRRGVTAMRRWEVADARVAAALATPCRRPGVLRRRPA